MPGVQGKTICAELIDDLVVVVHRPNTAPDPAEWSRYCEQVRSAWQRAEGMRTLVFTRGLAGAPSAKQRTEYNKAIVSADHCVAIVHDGSPLVHAALTAMSWFNPKVRAFHQQALADALRYLGLTPTPSLLSAIERMERHMGFEGVRRSASG